MAMVRVRIGRILPAELRDAWAMLHRGVLRGGAERGAERVADWIGRNGERHGFRPPNLAERSRVTGSAGYLEGLELPARALYDGQGNHFDRCVVPWRISRPVVRWTRGEELPRHAYPDVAHIEEGYQRLRTGVAADGIPVQDEAVPS